MLRADCFEQLPHGSQFRFEKFKPNSLLSKEAIASSAAILDYLLHHLQECEGKRLGKSIVMCRQRTPIHRLWWPLALHSRALGDAHLSCGSPCAQTSAWAGFSPGSGYCSCTVSWAFEYVGAGCRGGSLAQRQQTKPKPPSKSTKSTRQAVFDPSRWRNIDSALIFHWLESYIKRLDFGFSVLRLSGISFVLFVKKRTWKINTKTMLTWRTICLVFCRCNLKELMIKKPEFLRGLHVITKETLPEN